MLRVSPAWRGLRGTSFPSRRFIIMATESRYERSPRESAAIRARNGSCLAANARHEYSHREFADTVRVAGIFPDPSPGKASREAGVFGQSSHGEVLTSDFGCHRRASCRPMRGYRRIDYRVTAAKPLRVALVAGGRGGRSPTSSLAESLVPGERHVGKQKGRGEKPRPTTRDECLASP